MFVVVSCFVLVIGFLPVLVLVLGFGFVFVLLRRGNLGFGGRRIMRRASPKTFDVHEDRPIVRRARMGQNAHDLEIGMGVLVVSFAGGDGLDRVADFQSQPSRGGFEPITAS